MCSNILLAGLAFTDFCTGLIVEPNLVASGLIYVADYQMNLADQNSWPTAFFITMAIGKGCSMYFFQLTILIMTLTSIERWLHMSRRSLITVRRDVFMVAVFLLIPIPLVVTLVLGLDKSFIFRVTVTSTLVICLTLTSVSYFQVFRVIRRHQQQIHGNELSQNFTQPVTNFKKYKKSVFTILYIMAVFYICYLPTVVFQVLMVVFLENEFTFIFLTVSGTLVCFSSLLNPLLYFWRMKDIRDEVKLLVKRMFCSNN